jgi:hypothetical protein
LRAALNSAITQELTTFNPAAHVELDPAKRPKGLVWTAERVEAFRKTGQKPSPVMIWTPAQTGAFLDHVADDELYALFHLVALRGLRRGEACGLRWIDVDLTSRTITVARVGCSPGRTARGSAPTGCRITSTDFSPEAVCRPSGFTTFDTVLPRWPSRQAWT